MRLSRKAPDSGWCLVKTHNKSRHSGPAAPATLTSSRACAGRYKARAFWLVFSESNRTVAIF